MKVGTTCSEGRYHYFRDGEKVCVCGERDYMNRLLKPAKHGIAINLELLRAYMIEFIAEREQAGDLTRALTLSELLIWLQEKETHGQERHTKRVSNVLHIPQPGRARDC